MFRGSVIRGHPADSGKWAGQTTSKANLKGQLGSVA